MRTAALVAAATGAAAPPPSFLFLLGDDIGWADVSYNNGTAHTPRIDAWATRPGSVRLQDAHSGGTVCAPTRATVLTGRNHMRDCADDVYGCSDMTECEPKYPFAQHRTFTFADAVRAAGKGYQSIFLGKWHLGSFYNDSAFPSSPLFHGFDRMNATVEVAPTATTNCGCSADWEKSCNFGHYKKHNHCSGGAGPGAPAVPNGCCFNYWWEDPSAEHGVANLTDPVGVDDSAYLVDAFARFLDSRRGAPFAAQVSFHNCHIPFIGTAAARAACANGTACRGAGARGAAAGAYSDAQLDYYACLAELDASVGAALDALESRGYYDDTLVWFTTDNGPEGNCADGRCGAAHYRAYPGDAGPLRGRKRNVWEGGHRVPTVVSWPAVARGAARESWGLVSTVDWLPTVLDALGASRPAAQRAWPLDGKSILPILRGEQWPDRALGWLFYRFTPHADHAFRYGAWKWINATSALPCGYPHGNIPADADCRQEQLYDLSVDLSERHNVAAQRPGVLAAIRANFSSWYASVARSREDESRC